MANGFISRTLFTRHGTNNSTPMVWAVGWSSLRPIRRAASDSTRTFLSRAAIIAFIRSASKEEIRQAIRIAFRERPLALAGGLCARTFSRFEPSHGMALRCGAWAAGTETRSGASGVAADRTGPRAFHWDYHWRCSGGSNQPAAFSPEIFRRGHSVRVWIVPSFPVASPQLGGHASGFWRFDSLVVYHGISTRRRVDAYPVISQTSRRAARNSCGCNGLTHAFDVRFWIRQCQFTISAEWFSRRPHLWLSSGNWRGSNVGL